MKKTGKKWLGLHFETEELPKTTVSTVKSSKLAKRVDLPISKSRSFNFHHRLAPKTIPDLAVHSKKVEEVNSWLKSNVCDRKNGHTAKFLLITGPTGAGKTTTVQVLCQTLGIEITEWTNPVDQDFEVFRGPNQVTRFTEFLTESKWNSLFSVSDKKVILVEDFPNVFIRNPEEFDHVLEECYYKGNYPIIFICTDSVDNRINLAEKLFTQEIRIKYKIIEISFNACATTLMKNALKRAHKLVQENPDLFKTPSQSTVNAIIATAMGDIKCAVNQYYFASLLGTTDLPTVAQNSRKSGTKRKRNETSLSIQSMSRDQNLGLFHGVGRVLNPKRTEIGGSWRLQYDFDKLIDEFSTQPGSFTAFLFENYVKYYGDIGDLAEAAEILSFSQTFLEKWANGGDVLTFALWVSTLGLMVHNGHKVSKWTQITGPKKIKRKTQFGAHGKDVPVTELYYHNIINKIENPGFKIQ